MSLWQKIQRYFDAKLCKYIFCVILPFVLVPLAISPHKESRCAYAIIVVALYWLLEPVPVAVTALLPVVLFPLLGVLSSAVVCEEYINETFIMFIGGLIVAISIENCHLHERIALRVLLLVGTEAIWLMMGFMLTTMFLSMWISNTATTAMMVPIVEAVVSEMSTEVDNVEDDLPLKDIVGNSLTESQRNVRKETEVQIEKATKRETSSMKIVLLLSICYSANIGGTGTLTGTGPNLILKGLLDGYTSDEITFATWMMYNIPGMLLCVLIAWIYLYVIYIRCSKESHQLQGKEEIRKIIRRHYESLGSISFQQAVIIVCFTVLVILWIFRKPKFIMGWEDLIGSPVKLGNSIPAIAISFLLFLLPADPRRLTKGPPVLEWKTVQSKLPWGVILLVGGGFALAKGAEESKLSQYLGDKLTSLSVLSPGAIVAVICFITAIMTEVITNTAAANILLPVIYRMCVSMHVNPLFLMLPVTITCSFAFMLPVATPPNAIAYDSGHMKILDMLKPGFAMNIICCCVQIFMINTLGVAMFNLNEFPSWANTTNSSLLNTTVNISSTLVTITPTTQVT